MVKLFWGNFYRHLAIFLVTLPFSHFTLQTDIHYFKQKNYKKLSAGVPFVYVGR